MVADFAARVAKAATEDSDSVSTSAPETAPNTTQTTAQTSLSNVHNTNSANDANSQCNTGPPMPTQSIAGAGAGKTVSTIGSQLLGTCSNVGQIEPNTAKTTESKALQLPVKEFQPRSEVKSVTIEESSSPVVVPPVVAVANKDPVSVQLTAPTANAETATTVVTAEMTEPPEVVGPPAAAGVGIIAPEPAKPVNVPSSNVIQTTIAPYWSNITPTPELPKPSATASSANLVPTREPFPNLSKATSNSPPRRKLNATELPSNTKEQKERKTREKSLGSRGTTPTPVHNQAADHHHHHQKPNGDAAGDKTEAEAHPKNEVQQQKPADGECSLIFFSAIY